MGNTTVIEIDHDEVAAIEADHNVLVADILARIRDGHSEPGTPGVRFVATFNRNRGIVDRRWEEFKEVVRAVSRTAGLRGA